MIVNTPSPALSGKTALVTGASAGIGRAVACHLAAQGAAVVLHARRKERLQALAREIIDAGGNALVHAGDAGDRAAIDELVQAAINWRGQLDIVIANAGRGLIGSILTSDPATWDSLYKVNVTGAVYLMRLAAEHMAGLGRGDIVVLGSVAGHHISSFSGFYGSSKWALAGAAEALRREVCGRGVRVTIVKPGIVLSEFQEVAGYSAENFGRSVAKWGTPLQPDDVARTITFVVSQPPHVHLDDLVIRPTGQDYP